MTSPHLGQQAHGDAHRPLARRLLAPAGAAAGVAALSAALLLRDPHTSGSWGYCPLYATTGLDCPLCGSLRAVNDLGHGAFGAAVGSNALLVLVLLPLAMLVWARWALASVRAERPVPLRVPRVAAGVGMLVLVVAFGVLRNLPGLGALAA